MATKKIVGDLIVTGEIEGVAKAAALAPEYDSTATYAVDDLCTYNGILYKCTTAKTTTEDFDPNKWTAMNVAELIYGAIHSAY